MFLYRIFPWPSMPGSVTVFCTVLSHFSPIWRSGTSDFWGIVNILCKPEMISIDHKHHIVPRHPLPANSNAIYVTLTSEIMLSLDEKTFIMSLLGWGMKPKDRYMASCVIEVLFCSINENLLFPSPLITP